MADMNQNDDRKVLRWIRLRTDGVSSAEIARRYEVSPQTVRDRTNRVLAADIAESGEDVAIHYWPRKDNKCFSPQYS